MMKCYIFAICAVSLTTIVFCAPGYEHIREKQSKGQQVTEQWNTNVGSRRRRQNWETADVQIIDTTLTDSTELKDLRRKESPRLAPVNDMIDPEVNFQLQPGASTEFVTGSSNYVIYKVKSTSDRSSLPNGLPDDKTTRYSYYDSQNDNYDMEQYSSYSGERQLLPPPHPDDKGPPPPPPPHHPSSHHPPPPPPPNHYPPPPPHHHPPPPPPHHHPPPPPPHDYRSNYYDQSYSSYYDNSYNRPSPHPPPDSSRRIYDDRQTRQSSYYDRPHHDERPPPRNHDRPPPPPPPDQDWRPIPNNNGEPPSWCRGNPSSQCRPGLHQQFGSSPPHYGEPPDRFDDRPPPHDRRPAPHDRRPPPHDRRPPPHDRRPPPPPLDNRRPPPDKKEPYEGRNNHYSHYDGNQSYPNQDHSQNPRQNNSHLAKLTDATLNRDPNSDDRLDSNKYSTTEDKTDDNQYQLDIRFANDTPTPVKAITTTRPLSPFFFQAAAVTPED